MVRGPVACHSSSHRRPKFPLSIFFAFKTGHSVKNLWRQRRATVKKQPTCASGCKRVLFRIRKIRRERFFPLNVPVNPTPNKLVPETLLTISAVVQFPRPVRSHHTPRTTPLARPNGSVNPLGPTFSAVCASRWSRTSPVPSFAPLSRATGDFGRAMHASRFISPFCAAFAGPH